MLFGKPCNNIFSNPLIREHHYSYLHYIHCESSFSDLFFTLVFNPVKNKISEVFSKIIGFRFIYLPIKDVVVHFLNKLQEANAFSEQLVVVSFMIDELRIRQHFFETSEVEKIKRRKNSHQWLFRDIAQLLALHYTCFFLLTVLETVTISQIRLYSLFLRKNFQFFYQLFCNTLCPNRFELFKIVLFNWKEGKSQLEWRKFIPNFIHYSKKD